MLMALDSAISMLDMQIQIKKYAQKSHETMRMVLDAARLGQELVKEIKIKFVNKLADEFRARLRGRGYDVSNCAYDYDKRGIWWGFRIRKENWSERNWCNSSCPCFQIIELQGNECELLYGVWHGGFWHPLREIPWRIGLGRLKKHFPSQCNYFPDQYRYWNGAELLTNMAIEVGMFGDEIKPSYPVLEVYANTMIAFIDKTEETVEEYVDATYGKEIRKRGKRLVSQCIYCELNNGKKYKTCGGKYE